MAKPKDEIMKIKKKIVESLKSKGIKKAGIFGSYATGSARKNSDVDILIEFDGSLLKLIAMERELKKILKRKVDLLTYREISPYLRERILKEEIRII